jgi:hypothetical protein
MRHLANIMCKAGVLCTLLFASASAHAEGQHEASATGKGIAGGALLGAEVVMLTEAALDVKPGWAYAVGGIAGGIGGGVAGFFVEDSSTKASFYMLAGGMALIIPTTVAVLATTAYEPPADYTEDKGPTDEPVADPPQPGASRSTDAPQRTATHTPVRPDRLTTPRLELRPPPALVDVGQGLVSLSVPAIEVRDAYTPREMAEFGVEQRTELRVPVLNVAF